MSGPFHDHAYARPAPDISLHVQPLPDYLARRLLRPDEKILWVRGPRKNPGCEPYLTHPVLVLAALTVGATCLGAARLSSESWSAMPAWPMLTAGGMFIAAVYILGIANTYFTRLVVTDARLVIMQGFETCRVWRLDDLPESLVRYDMRRGARNQRTVDLDALQTMLGGSSAQFADAKTIRTFGKLLDQIKPRDKDRPGAR
jgi:hypothetical protein